MNDDISYILHTSVKVLPRFGKLNEFRKRASFASLSVKRFDITHTKYH